MNTNVTGAEESRLRAFADIIGYTPDEADCALCLNQLEDHLQAQRRGAARGAVRGHEFAWTARHLDSCVACAEAYALLYEVALAEENGRLPHPTPLPEPDLSFLQPRPDWLAALQTALSATAERLVLQLNETLAHLLAPAPAPTLTRSVANGRYTPKLLELTPDQAQAAALPFTLAAYADQQQPDRCLVEVTAQPPGQSWPDLGGYQVRLTVGGQTFTGETDDWGTAVFPDLPRAQLNQLQIELALARGPA
jgi:hypothetical protein